MKVLDKKFKMLQKHTTKCKLISQYDIMYSSSQKLHEKNSICHGSKQDVLFSFWEENLKFYDHQSPSEKYAIAQYKVEGD